MKPSTVVFLDEDLESRVRAEVERAGGQSLLIDPPHLTPPPDPRPWERAVSELALFHWLLLPSEHAVAALLDSAGAPPGPTLRVAAVGSAAAELTRHGRKPDEVADSLRALVERLGPRIGRRRRVLVPHVTSGAKRLDEWVTGRGAEAVCVPAFGFAPDPIFTEALSSDLSTTVVIASAGEAERLCSLAATCPSEAMRTVPVAALDAAAAEAALDCGIAHIRVSDRRLGPFLAEALS